MALEPARPRGSTVASAHHHPTGRGEWCAMALEHRFSPKDHEGGGRPARVSSAACATVKLVTHWRVRSRPSMSTSLSLRQELAGDLRQAVPGSMRS
jgi:hypothetical protein